MPVYSQQPVISERWTIVPSCSPVTRFNQGFFSNDCAVSYTFSFSSSPALAMPLEPLQALYECCVQSGMANQMKADDYFVLSALKVLQMLLK